MVILEKNISHGKKLIYFDMNNKPSSSPDRNTFQVNKYVEHKESIGEPVEDDVLNMWDVLKKEHEHKFDDPEVRKNNMEYDLLSTEWILEKVRESEVYAQNLYAALCNNDFMKNEIWPILQEQTWSCSWRYAGGIIADMRGEGDYIDWYCSGIRGEPIEQSEFDNLTEDGKIRYLELQAYVSESTVTDEVRKDLLTLGWNVATESDKY